MREIEQIEPWDIADEKIEIAPREFSRPNQIYKDPILFDGILDEDFETSISYIFVQNEMESKVTCL